MADEQTQENPQEDQIDVEVAECMEDLIGMICDTDGVTISRIRGYKNVTFVVDLKDSKHRGMLIGREGKTIHALQHIVHTIGGAYKKRYNLELRDPPDVQRDPT